MTHDDPAARILRNLGGNPEKVATYLNTRAAADLRELVDEVRAARRLAHANRDARLALQRLARQQQDELDRLRRMVRQQDDTKGTT
jgi:hypothetical protein